MSDGVDYGEYEEDEYAEMEQGGDSDESSRFERNFVNARGCTNGSCENQNNPGEEPWLQLMSCIPVTGQIGKIKPIPSGMATPNDMEVSEIVEQLRGSDGDDYAIQAIKEGWQDFMDVFQPLEGHLQTALEALSQEWTGDDYDAFEEQVEIVKGNLAKVKEDIGSADGQGGGNGILAMLEQKQLSIYALQGGDAGEVLFPAPLVWVDGRGFWKSAQFHVRPAFWAGECEIIDDACANDSGNDILELAGYPDNDDYRNEVTQFETDRAAYYESNGYSPSEAQSMAEEDANAQVTQDVDDLDEDYQQRLDNITTDITTRRDMADDEVGGFSPTVSNSDATSVGDGGADPMGYDGLNPGGGGSGDVPTMPGGGGLNPPGGPSGGIGGGGGFDPPSPPGSPGGPGLGDPPGGDGGGLDPDNPWGSGGIDDPDDIGGGLASGGGGAVAPPGIGTGGGGPGGLGPGAGAGAGAGAGGMGMMGAGGMGAGRGAGAGAAGGRGAGGRGAGGMGAGRGAGAGGRGMTGMMGGGAGGRPGMGAGEGEGNGDTWLTEEDDVWGIGNEDDDPYA
ncbi:hypothetical protein [Glycomyces salinus]|uniref:hypothetical protein n=1 Tax=Glycomyces salinus TaxID=980294 RepID=UPI0018EB3378|nr:hypothetical protein [Glycomyces salinus]